MANIVNPNLPADLPTDWTTSQYVSPNGSEVSLSQQHGYNYLMEQVNAAQTAVNTLAEQAQEAVSGLESGALTATATRSGTTVAITGPEDAVTVTFLAPADWTEGDSYTYNGTPITVTDLNGNPVTDGWKQGAVLTFQISGGVAYFVGGASGSFLPLSGGTMTGPAVGAPGGSTIPQFRNVYYGTEALTPGSSPLPEGTLYITPEMEYEGAGKRTCRFVVGTSTAGWTAADCDYLCDGTADDVEINAAIQALPSTGGEIVILDGTYNITATITVNKNNVTLTGNGAATILLRSASFLNVVSLLSVTGCAIRNLTINGNKTTYTAASNGINIGSSSDNAITGNICNNSSSGIYISSSSSSGNIITGNICNDNSVGINLYAANNNAITGNTCNNNSTGINLNPSSNNTVTGNTCNNNTNGMFLHSDSDTITSNACNNNSTGIYLDSFTNGLVTGNVCNSNSSYGIFVLASSSDNTITGNTCNDNASGIYLGASSGNAITGNTCNNNTNYGIYLGSSNGTVTGNTCICGTGQTSDYTSSQYTILTIAHAFNNVIVGNNIMGKNYVDNGTNNTWANNKFE